MRDKLLDAYAVADDWVHDKMPKPVRRLWDRATGRPNTAWVDRFVHQPMYAR